MNRVVLRCRVLAFWHTSIGRLVTLIAAAARRCKIKKKGRPVDVELVRDVYDRPKRDLSVT